LASMKNAPLALLALVVSGVHCQTAPPPPPPCPTVASGLPSLSVANGETRTLTTTSAGLDYSTVSVAMGGVLLATGSDPLIIRATGDVSISGTINVSGTRGGNSAGDHMAAGGGGGGGALKIAAQSIHIASTGAIHADGGDGGDAGGPEQSFIIVAGDGSGGVGGPGGYSGGGGGASSQAGNPGSGPGASSGGAFDGGVPPGAGGAGHANQGGNGFAQYTGLIQQGGPAYGDPSSYADAFYSVELQGGSGAGGGGNDGDNEEAAGGGGSGGTVHLIATTLQIEGTVSAIGGLGGLDDYHYSPGMSRACCNNGGPGSVGRIRLDYETLSAGSSATIAPAAGYELNYATNQHGTLCLPRVACNCPDSFPMCHSDGDCVIRSCATGTCSWSLNTNYISGTGTVASCCGNAPAGPPSPPPAPPPPALPPPPPASPPRPVSPGRWRAHKHGDAAQQASSQGDPHLSLAHGARADFRGRHGGIFNFLSAQKLSVNALISNASFQLREPPQYATIRVDGTFITEAYVVGMTSQGRFFNLTFGTGLDSRLLRLRRRRLRRRLREDAANNAKRAVEASCSLKDLPGPPYPMRFEERAWPSAQGDELFPTLIGACDELTVKVTEVRRFGGKKSVHIPTMELQAPDWKLTVENRPVYSWITGPHRRLDLRIELTTPEARLPTMPHGIIGQSWDGDGRGTNGRMDEYPKTEGARFTTSAMAEGAIEGIPAHYEVATPYDVRFLYSRFGTQHMPARNTQGLNVSKEVSMLSSPSVAGASDERAQ